VHLKLGGTPRLSAANGAAIPAVGAWKRVVSLGHAFGFDGEPTIRCRQALQFGQLASPAGKLGIWS